MKTLFVIILTTFALAAHAQQKVLEPEGFSSWPNIHPDTLMEYAKQKQVYDSIVFLVERNDGNTGILSSEQLTIYFNEFPYSLDEGPYYTGPIGCSWYCAPEQDTCFASSTLAPQGNPNYAAIKAFDFNVSTAWVEGVKGDGIGETLSLSIKVGNLHQLASVEIYNGYCKDVTTWQNNNRVKELEMYVNGKSIGVLHLTDTYLGQRFNIGSYYPINDELKLQFKIKSVYKGDKYDDTAISDIVFDGKYLH